MLDSNELPRLLSIPPLVLDLIDRNPALALEDVWLEAVGEARRTAAAEAEEVTSPTPEEAENIIESLFFPVPRETSYLAQALRQFVSSARSLVPQLSEELGLGFDATWQVRQFVSSAPPLVPQLLEGEGLGATEQLSEDEEENLGVGAAEPERRGFF